VPYVYEKEHITRQGDISYRPSREICEVYTWLKQFCDEKNFEILPPTTENYSYFRTVAVFKKRVYGRASTCIEAMFKNYANRIVALERTADKNAGIIVGVHVPKDCKEYWDSLISVHQKLPENKRIIYIGDLNTYIPGTTNKNNLYRLLSKGLIDIWLETGGTHTRETYDMHMRIDYALMTGKDFDNMKPKMVIDDTIRYQGYSDHSAIMLKL